ncbi:MAG: M48 family metallopeptidase [Candidatus Tectomicrobia bacterium]|nr:M48 family metallopeptidase [Candidatus Tectomicrobia bacterium]
MRFEGHLTDGKTAWRLPVRVALLGDRLQILDERGGLLDEWPLEGLRLAEEVYRRQPVRLVHRARGEACLTLEGQEILEPLGRAAPRLRKRYYGRRSAFVRAAIWGSALGAAVVGAILVVPRLARPLAQVVPLRWQEALGAAVLEHFGGKAALCETEAGEAALRTLTERLAVTVKTPDRFQVSVMRRPDANAFATPGGRIVLFEGFLMSADSPEEIAGVLAHEMAHVVKRHPMEGLIRAMGFWLVLSALAGDVSSVPSAVGKFGQVFLTLSYSREKESEADRLAVEMLRKAEIRSDGLIAFFQRLEERGRDVPGALRFLSTHPLHGERVAALRALARDGGEALTPQAWRDLKGICGGIRPGEAGRREE